MAQFREPFFPNLVQSRQFFREGAAGNCARRPTNSPRRAYLPSEAQLIKLRAAFRYERAAPPIDALVMNPVGEGRIFGPERRDIAMAEAGFESHELG